MNTKVRSPKKSILAAILALAFAVFATAGFAGESGSGQGAEIGATGTKPPVEAKAEQPVELPKGVSHLKFRAGLLEIKAEGAELTEVLKAVSKETGVEIDNPDEISGKVTLEVKGSWLQDGLIKILEAAKVNSYAFSFNDSKETRLYKITILKDGKAGAEKGATIAQKPANYPAPGLKRKWTDEEAMAYFHTKYGEWLNARGGDQNGFVFRGARGIFPDWISIETQEDALRFAESFIADNPEAFQLGESELRPDPIHWQGEYRSVRFEQFYKDISVDGGFVEFTFYQSDRQIHILNNIGPTIELSTEPKITAEEAIEIAKSHLNGFKEKKGVTPQFNNMQFNNPGLIFRFDLHKKNKALKWQFELDDYIYWIDASDGSVDFMINEVQAEPSRMR